MNMIYRKVIKRLLGIFFALIALPFVAVIAIPVAIAIKLEDGGPVFYADKRLGKDFKEFRMIKFRSMKVNAPDIRNKDGTTFNSEFDPRLTKVGSFIRKTSIDELPQVINILKGDMAWVGPRPSPLGNMDKYPEFYLKKFTVLPGLTGYMQSTFRNTNTLQQHYEGDVYYVEHISFFFDAKIVLMTIPTVLLQRGIYRNK